MFWDGSRPIDEDTRLRAPRSALVLFVFTVQGPGPFPCSTDVGSTRQTPPAIGDVTRRT
jgi:hypothetical protein